MNLEQWSAEKEATPAELRRWGVDAEALLKILDGQRIQRFATVSALRSAEANVRAQMDEDVRRLVTAADNAYRLLGMAAPRAFENGVTDPTGTIDEGEARAGQISGDLRAALEPFKAVPTAEPNEVER